VEECKALPMTNMRPVVWRRKLSLKPEVESSVAHISFRRLIPVGFNVVLIGSTCIALPWRGPPAALPAGPPAASAPRARGSHLSTFQLKLSAGRTCPVYPLEIDGLFTQGSRPSRTLGESVVGISEMDFSDSSNGIRYHIFVTRPGTEFSVRNFCGERRVGQWAS
jgi:hypothetical protein